MKVLTVIVGICFITDVLSQGLNQPFRSENVLLNRRALTPIQQTQILSDVQQHHHRFSFPQNQIINQNKNPKSHSVLIEPAIQQQLPTQTTIIHHRSSPNVHQNQGQFPFQQQHQQQQHQQQQHQQQQFSQQGHSNFRGSAPQSNGKNDLHVQHHTQTNFIPNFAQRQQQPVQFQQTRPVQQQPIPQQPLPQQQLPQQQPIFDRPNQIQQQGFDRQQQQLSQPQFQQQFTGPHPIEQSLPQLHQQPLHQRSIQQDFNQQIQLQQKPFHPSIQLSPTLEPLAPTQSSPQATFIQQPSFVQPSQPIIVPQQPTTLQNHLFSSPSQNPFNQPQNFQQRPQILQIQPSQQISDQFLQQRFQQPQINTFISQQQQQQQFPSLNSQIQTFRNSQEDDEKLREKQQIIQKHEQFVQKQYQKQQNKVRQQHEDFLLKQRRIKEQSVALNRQISNGQPKQYSKNRSVYPFDANVFHRAVKNYYEANPTPAPTTTTEATEATTVVRIQTTSLRPQKQKKLKPKSEISDDELEQFLKNHRQKLYGELQLEADRQSKPTKSKAKSTKALGRDDLLKQLKLALAEAPQEIGNKSYSSMDLTLPGGQKVQVIRTSDPSLIQGAGVKALNAEDLSEISAEKLIASPSTKKPEVFYDELSKSGFLPPGAEFEVIKQSEDGALQPVEKIPNQKKVTFVYLEEQSDGSYKVQGVKANGDKEAKTKGTEVDNIIKRIRNGDIQLPPPSKTVGPSPKSSSSSTSTTGAVSSSTGAHSSTIAVISSTSSPSLSSSSSSSSSPNSLSVIPLSTTQHESSTYRSPFSSPSASPSPILRFSSSVSPYSTLATIASENIVQLTAAPSTHFPSSTYSTYHPSFSASSTTETPSTSSFAESTLPRSTPRDYTSDHSVSSQHFSSSPHDTTQSRVSSSSSSGSSSSRRHTPTPHFSRSSPTASSASVSPSSSSSSSSSSSASPSSSSSSTTSSSSTVATPTINQDAPIQGDLTQILKNSNLHAMAKYLKQSGLDAILNETGPYTVFAPTDKAFKNLLIQLGGPERAEEKFKSNPRLLSGLLLHHVIPGSFEIGTLQDEMTGVSLAGTQLRVNQYNMHDSEWNDIKITTINGAMVVPEKADIPIPQGVAHAVDRVMFPLPVGDLLQTLQSDRERRFTQFLRALFASGMSDLLQNKDNAGYKTYTVFAPSDAAFDSLPREELENVVNDKEAATKLVMKHIMPGSLFSAGMRFYQVKDSLTGGQPITLQKTSSGKIKVNESHILTSNIPATNGVIHAIDSLL